MNILFCERLRATDIWSSKVHMYELMSNLSKLGHKIVPINADHPKNEAEISTNQRLSLREHLKCSLLRSRIFWVLGGEITILWFLLSGLYVFLSAFTTILRRREKFDVIYRRHYLFNTEYILAKLLRIPLVKEVNGIVIDEIRVSRWGNRISLLTIDRIERFNMPRADKIIVVTSRLKEVLQRDYGVAENKIVVIPNGANTDLFKPMDATKAREELGLSLSDSYVCFVGNLWQAQGVEYLIRAAPLILESYPNTQFLIVGDGQMRTELIELAKQTGVSDKVIFTGMVPYQKVPLYVNASDVCVMPAIGERNERSGVSPLKLCEYMACEKPVVAARLSGLEVLERNEAGILVEPENPAELATAIIKLLQNQELRKQMGANGRKYVVENRSWESVAKRVADVCQEAVKNHSSAGHVGISLH